MALRRLGTRLATLSPSEHTQSPPPRPPEPGSEPMALPVHADDKDGIWHLRPWWMAPTPYGRCHVAIERQPAEPPVPSPCLVHLLGDERLRGFEPEKAMYLDIEATGLSHGAGTFAFLIGCAYHQDGEVVLEQLFMRDPSDEMPVLCRFLELLERFPYLVSFNGKSYDLSVLQSRLVITRLLSRLETELKVRPHLDLLHVTRQAYKGVFENSKLQTIEREVLHIDPWERVDDVPGSLVPALYFHYLQTGYAPQLNPVLKHNRTDVLSMITLTRHLLALMEAPWGAHPTVLYNLGRAALRRKHNARAVKLLREATGDCRLPNSLSRKVWLELVTAARRAGDVELALLAAERSLDLVPEWEPAGERERLQRQVTRFQRKISRSIVAQHPA